MYVSHASVKNECWFVLRKYNLVTPDFALLIQTRLLDDPSRAMNELDVDWLISYRHKDDSENVKIEVTANSPSIAMQNFHREAKSLVEKNGIYIS